MSGIMKWLRSLLFFRKEKDTDGYALKNETRQLAGNAFMRSSFQSEDCETHHSYCDREGLHLDLRKGSCLAWSELEDWRLADMELAAEIETHNEGRYTACGLIFRKNEDDNYYIFLVSSKNWWRLDVVFNGKPRTLIPWTEVPAIPEELDHERPAGSISLRVIAIDTRIALVINNTWAGEVEDDTLAAGTMALAHVNYDDEGSPSVTMQKLDIEGHPRRVEEAWIRWTAWLRPRRAARLALANSFMTMGQASAALVQVQRIWKRSEDRLEAELLLAIDASIRLALLDDARRYLDELCSKSGTAENWSPELLDRHSTLLYLEGNNPGLEENTRRYLAQYGDSRVQRSLLAHALSNMGRHQEAATEYESAAAQRSTQHVEPDTDQATQEDSPEVAETDVAGGILLKNAAQEYERSGSIERAVERYLEAGSLFLKAEDYDELGLLLPSLLQAGPRDPRSHALCAKYHFAREEWHAARLALKSARSLALGSGVSGNRTEGKDERFMLDPAIPYLEALLLIREGARKQAIPLLEEACSLDPDYFPFLFRLIESRWLLGARKDRKTLDEELSRALCHPEADGWLYNMAAQIDMERGHLDEAEQKLERALELLGPLKEVLVNRAALAANRGEGETALSILDRIEEQSDALVGTTRGNILYQLGRLDEAETAFRAVLRREGDEPEHLRNLAGCLIEQGRYGEADELLARACERDPGVKTLELTAYVAAKKGEFPRAEAALNMALDIDPDNQDLLFSLAWNYLRQSRPQEALDSAERIRERISTLSSSQRELAEALSLRLEELETAIRATTHRSIHCARCGLGWDVPRDLPVQGTLRLVAEPPDDMPAGSCPLCHKTWCIGCVKDTLKDGRFQCPDCAEALKLSDDGLKKVLTDWLASLTSTAGS